MTPAEHILGRTRKVWLVTGAAGFIGSNLTEALLRAQQRVIGLDNFSTGRRENLEGVRSTVTGEQWRRFKFIEADICDSAGYVKYLKQADVVLHQAALGSVPRSLERPLASHASNVTGFLTLLDAARHAKVGRVVYASSSTVYGDDPRLPKKEANTGRPLSPYGATKVMGELYAEIFGRCYGYGTIGLRYFNVFGPRQSPDGPYAAVIPKWVAAMMRGEPLVINGDGETSRDFCYVANVVQANLRAALVTRPEAVGQVYNVAFHRRTTLNQLFEMLRKRLLPSFPHLEEYKPVYREFRAGDVRHSLADISKAKRLLGYKPTHDLGSGLDEALAWYVENAGPLNQEKGKICDD